ncbi:hypothetical protein ACIB24_13040 [Spongisporangium articulatum]|uniref:Uncharacterized protein n=1 Tax=Spongisporangium articulatum TaxID=3362603 RepID=A0ABW8ANN5_9ACTN
MEQALAAIGRVEPEVAEDARAAWESLTGGQGPESLTQWRLQQFLWDELSRSSSTDAPARWRVASALAALLDGLGMQRYSSIARSETTRQILASGESTPDRGRTAVRRAMQRSGIEPPDTELLTWGSVSGQVEAQALEAVADRLELAVAVGDLVPGGRGWRDQQAEIAVDVLMAPRLETSGESFYDGILDERLDHWVRGPRSTTRGGLLAPLELALREPVDPGMAAPARALLRPLDWLLTEIGDGLALTAAGYLPPRTVSRALDELGWRDELIGPANREVDAYPVLVLRETAQRLGLARRRGARLTLTPGGRAALADGRTLWQAVAAGLVGPEHSALAVAWEVVLAVLATGDVVGEEDVRVLVQQVITESGWRVAGRRTPSESDTSALFFAVLRELRWLELVEETGALLDRRLRARAGAPDLFRSALRHRVLHRDVVPF